MMTLDQFRNALAALRNLDQHELVAAGVERMRQGKDWRIWCENPAAEFMRATPAEQQAIFGLIGRGQRGTSTELNPERNIA